MSHEGFADEDGTGTGRVQSVDVGGAMDSAFGDEDGVRAGAGKPEASGQAFGGTEVDLEQVEVAVVDADEGRADVQGAVQFGFVVNFDEHGEAGGAAEVVEPPQAVVVENGGDEEDGVGAPLDGFGDLSFVDDEVLAEEGEGDGGSDLAEVGEGALEEFFVGEHRETVGAGGFVIAGDGDGIEVGSDDAGGGGGFFDFGDEADSAAAGVGEGGGEVAGTEGVAALDEGAEVLRGGWLGGEERDLALFLFDDGVEDGHALEAGGEGGVNLRRP